MRCKFCTAPLPKRGPMCNYCGQRNPLNLNVLSKVDIEEKKAEDNCPVCSTHFEQINVGLNTSVLIQRCNDCDGVFIKEDILEQLIKKKTIENNKIDFHILRFIQDNPRQKKETIIRYRHCPICKNMMQRINYRAVSGVIVDRCLRHGIWLDGGELRQLFEWKKAGGTLKKEIKKKEIKQESVNKFIYDSSNKTAYFDPLGDFFTWLQGG